MIKDVLNPKYENLRPYLDRTTWMVVPSTKGGFAVVDNGIQVTVLHCDTEQDVAQLGLANELPNNDMQWDIYND